MPVVVHMKSQPTLGDSKEPRISPPGIDIRMNTTSA
jgi:hypothetical protein